MPLNDRFYNPGSAATNALLDFLTQREATKRQAFLDDLKRQEFEQQKRATDQRIELDREQAAGLREQREAAAELNRQKKALGVMTMLEPDASIGAGTADTIREGGFEDLVGPYAQNANAAPTGPADDPRSYASTTYKGTPQQRRLRDFIARTDPQSAA